MKHSLTRLQSAVNFLSQAIFHQHNKLPSFSEFTINPLCEIHLMSMHCFHCSGVGEYMTTDLESLTTDQVLASDDLLKATCCNWKTGCSSCRCTSKYHGVYCVAACAHYHVEGCENAGLSVVQDEEVSGSEIDTTVRRTQTGCWVMRNSCMTLCWTKTWTGWMKSPSQSSLSKALLSLLKRKILDKHWNVNIFIKTR